MFLGNEQERHYSRNARRERRLSVHLVGEMKDIHGERRVRTMLKPSHRWEKSHALFGQSLLETTRGAIIRQCNPGASGSQHSGEFLLANQLPRVVFRHDMPRSVTTRHFLYMTRHGTTTSAHHVANMT